MLHHPGEGLHRFGIYLHHVGKRLLLTGFQLQHPGKDLHQLGNNLPHSGNDLHLTGFQLHRLGKCLHHTGNYLHQFFQNYRLLRVGFVTGYFCCGLESLLFRHSPLFYNTFSIYHSSCNSIQQICMTLVTSKHRTVSCASSGVIPTQEESLNIRRLLFLRPLFLLRVIFVTRLAVLYSTFVIPHSLFLLQPHQIIKQIGIARNTQLFA